MADRKEWQAHWREYNNGVLPPIISLLGDMNDIVAESYTRQREWLFEQRPDGLSRGQKELLFAILDIFIDHAEGARQHINAALDAGLPPIQAREALTQVFMLRGMSSFAEIGHEIWEACQKRS